MNNVRKVTDDLFWIGANDHRTHLFENIHPIPQGVSYNSYLLLDEATVLMDTIDWSECRQWLENLEHVLDGRPLDYLVVHHLEPDHAASLEEVLIRHPETTLISSEKGFMLMRQFGYDPSGHECLTVKEGDTVSFGNHALTFVEAPMVHWPEVLVSLDTANGVLFSADAFGSFIALDGRLFNDEVNFDRDWLDEARRYYTNIVGKYGPHVQHLLKKAAPLFADGAVKMIAPLHGPIWRNDFDYIIDKYDRWSSYTPEDPDGVVIVYASMYGNTESAAQALASRLVESGLTNVRVYDVSSTPVSTLIAEVFRASHLVLASVTYNLGIYPPMHNFLHDMKALNVQKRKTAILENGSWAPRSGDLMEKFVREEMKNMEVLDNRLSVASTLNNDRASDLEALARTIVESVEKEKQSAAV